MIIEDSNSAVEPGGLAVVALGSNLGDSIGTIIAAMEELKRLGGIGTFLQSSLWKSSPVDCPPGSPAFVNAVVAFIPSMDETPEMLLAKLQRIELAFGRTRTAPANASRTLDLDLIAFGHETRSRAELTVPHPRASVRRFVLAPLAEILPHFRAPGWTATAKTLLSTLQSDEMVERIPDT